jgi:threonine synthase
MRYVSTRSKAPALGFEETLLEGLARDGGLYVPEEWPVFSNEQIAALAGASYQELAVEIMYPFVAEDMAREELASHVDAAYDGFRHAAITPLVQLGSRLWLLELFHGPTLAFKDIALQLLARLMDNALRKRGRHATIVGATSGDTGSAAIEAFRNCRQADIFILHPKGRVSNIQRRQMTTVDAPNVHNIALEGTFDDCQRLVKELFADAAFRDRVALGSVNSINWARVMAQIVYYFAAALSLGAPNRKLRFAVPTGNFGDIFAGYVARCMGLPVEKLIIATNVNDILHRALSGGRYEISNVISTMSPSIDIQVSSNFERLLFDLQQRDGAMIAAQMASLMQNGSFAIQAEALQKMRDIFLSARVDEAETTAMIAQTYRETGHLIDPHSAVGLASARRLEAPQEIPVASLATAHAAKFPEAVKSATGMEPQLPETLSDLLTRKEHYITMKGDLLFLKKHILANQSSRA